MSESKPGRAADPVGPHGRAGRSPPWPHDGFVDVIDGPLGKWARGRLATHELIGELRALEDHPLEVRVGQARRLISLLGIDSAATQLEIAVRLGVPPARAVRDSAGNSFGDIDGAVRHLTGGAAPQDVYVLVEQAAEWRTETDVTSVVVGLAAYPSSRDRTRGWPAEARRPRLHWYSRSVALDGWAPDDGTALSPAWPSPLSHPPREALRQARWPDAVAALAMLGFEIGYPAPAGPWEEGLLVVAVNGNDPNVVLLGHDADRPSVRVPWEEIDRPTSTGGVPRLELIADERSPAERIGQSLFGSRRDPLPARGIGLWHPGLSGWVVVTSVDREGQSLSCHPVGTDSQCITSWESLFTDHDQES